MSIQNLHPKFLSEFLSHFEEAMGSFIHDAGWLALKRQECKSEQSEFSVARVRERKANPRVSYLSYRLDSILIHLLLIQCFLASFRCLQGCILVLPHAFCWFWFLVVKEWIFQSDDASLHTIFCISGLWLHQWQSWGVTAKGWWWQMWDWHCAFLPFQRISSNHSCILNGCVFHIWSMMIPGVSSRTPNLHKLQEAYLDLNNHCNKWVTGKYPIHSSNWRYGSRNFAKFGCAAHAERWKWSNGSSRNFLTHVDVRRDGAY
jgi:hypothetical protein